jgi:hypothetical protein
MSTSDNRRAVVNTAIDGHVVEVKGFKPQNTYKLHDPDKEFDALLDALSFPNTDLRPLFKAIEERKIGLNDTEKKSKIIEKLKNLINKIPKEFNRADLFYIFRALLQFESPELTVGELFEYAEQLRNYATISNIIQQDIAYLPEVRKTTKKIYLSIMEKIAQRLQDAQKHKNILIDPSDTDLNSKIPNLILNNLREKFPFIVSLGVASMFSETPVQNSGLKFSTGDEIMIKKFTPIFSSLDRLKSLDHETKEQIYHYLEKKFSIHTKLKTPKIPEVKKANPNFDPSIYLVLDSIYNYVTGTNSKLTQAEIAYVPIYIYYGLTRVAAKSSQEQPTQT